MYVRRGPRPFWGLNLGGLCGQTTHFSTSATNKGTLLPLATGKLWKPAAGMETRVKPFNLPQQGTNDDSSIEYVNSTLKFPACTPLDLFFLPRVTLSKALPKKS